MRWTWLLALGAASACGGVSAGSSCPADQPSGFGCVQQLSVEQSQCMGDPDGSVLTPTVHWSTNGKALQVEAAAFRCDQTVCAYLDTSSATAQVLLQPCDMKPSTVTRCDCGYAFSVPVSLPASTAGVDVELRSDSAGGSHEAKTIASLAVGPAAKLCDGSSALRFAASNGGGNLSGIPSLIGEVGWSFLLVDGQCRYYAMSEPEREIRNGLLSEADAASFSQDFLLGNWSSLNEPGSGCPDAGTDAFAFGADRAQSSCQNTALTMANYTWLPRLYDAGSAVSGPMRYAVVTASNEQWPESNPELAVSYPLTDPSNVASDPNEQAQVQTATGDDADALRAARASYQAKAGSSFGPQYSVPVVVSSAIAPKYFDLALRDTVPFEKDGALAINVFIQ